MMVHIVEFSFFPTNLAFGRTLSAKELSAFCVLMSRFTAAYLALHTKDYFFFSYNNYYYLYYYFQDDLQHNHDDYDEWEISTLSYKAPKSLYFCRS